jgi:hypothetical protein
MGEGSQTQKETNSVALTPQANYTDWSTATCRLNLVPTFVDRGVSRGQRDGSRTVVNLSFLDRSRTFLSSRSSFILTRAVWTPFHTHCYSENLVTPGIQLGASRLAARNSDHNMKIRPQSTDCPKSLELMNSFLYYAHSRISVHCWAAIPCLCGC